MLEIGLYHFYSKIISFSISPLTYNGEVTWLTWPPGDPSKKNEIYKMFILGGLLIGSKSFIFLRQMSWSWQCCEITSLFSRGLRMTKYVSDLTLPENATDAKRSGLKHGTAMPTFSSLSITHSEQSRKNRQGVAPTTPPPPSAVEG